MVGAGRVKVAARAFAAAAVAVTLSGDAMADYDFEKAWESVLEAQSKGLPRTVTNKLEEIAREAKAAERWPDAARAFIMREGELGTFTDEEPAEWLPAFAASVDAEPAPLQAVLQLHLAHTYRENSRRRRWGGSGPTKLDDAAAEGKAPPWSPEKIAATLEAQFEKVFARSAELKAQGLRDWRALFDSGSLPRSYVPTLFDFAVYDTVQFYGETIPDKTLERGCALYDRLLDFHREDGNLEALAFAELERAEYVRDFAQKPARARKADFAAFLDGFIERHSECCAVSAMAAARKAESLRDAERLVEAHALASEYAKKWPDSPGGYACANLVDDIEAKSLSVETERNWCAPWPEIKVKARNLDEVHFRIVPVAYKDFVDDTSMGADGYNSTADDAMAEKYLKRKCAKEWTERFELKPDFSEQTFKVACPPDLKPGHYVLYAAANDKFGKDKLPLLARRVTVTSLALALETGNGKFGGTVYRADPGTPVAGATVELWGYGPRGGRREKLLETYMTDADGRFVADVSKGRNGMLDRFVRVVKDGEEVLSLKRDGSGYVYDDERETDYVDLFTDRSLYRPGQEIMVKGIAYHADPDTRDFHTRPGAMVELSLSDPNEKEVASVRLRTNKWGSFAHAFAAPAGRLTGSYRITARIAARGGATGSSTKSVNVEEYKRPKFSAKLEKASADATLGVPVSIAGSALSYSGLPVQGATVAWHVERRTRYPGWWSWFGFGGDDDDGEGFVAEGETETDADGGFTVTFTPVASPTADLSGDPSFEFSVVATVTDGTGEARSAAESFEIGTVAWRANVWTSGKWHTAERPVEVKVALESLAGTKVPVKGVLRAYRLKGPERPVRKNAEPARYDGGREEKGPWDWTTWEQGEEALSVAADSGDSGKWTASLPLGVGAYRIVFEAKDPNGKTVKDMDHVFVFDPAAKSLGVAVPHFLTTEAGRVKVGETLRSFWGTGYESGCCRIKVTSNGKTIEERTVDATAWLYELPIKDEHRGEMRIETTFVRENRIYHEYDVVHVPWDNKELDVRAEHMTSKLNPGVEETWKFKVSGPAEVLAFMYDRSLDAYKWHDVSLGFSSRFTPWTRYISSPCLQNTESSLSSLSGWFPGGRHGNMRISLPSWRTFDTSTVMKRRAERNGRRRFAGAGVVEECGMELCEDAVEVPACRSPVMMKSAVGSRNAPSEDEAESVAPRANLKETAFFFPDLETDADGNVSFTFAAPDALTGWKLLMVAHDNELRGGVFRNDEIVTTKPLMCEPNPPRFAREGDDFLFAVKVTNTEDVPQSGEVSLELEELGGGRTSEVETVVGSRVSNVEKPGGDSRQPTCDSRDDLRLATCDMQPFELKPHESKTFEFRVAIPDGCGYLKYVAKADGGKFADGEEGVLPVLSRRILVREAVQLNARGNETKTFRLENLVASEGSDTIRHQDLTVRAVSRPAWYAVMSLPYLMEFPHECCEQTFSRYYANALGKFIANADPRIRETFDAWKAADAAALRSPLETDPHLKSIALDSTPWVREAAHETAARARLGALFEEGRLEDEQARCIEKLRMERNGDGRWPWFPGGLSSDYITMYILTGFARLNHLAKVDWPDFFASALAALDREVSDDVKRRLKGDRLPFHVNGFDVRWLYLHSFGGVAAARDKSLAPRFVKHLREEWTALGLETQALAAIALKRMGEGALAKEIMASVKERAVVSDELGMYWKRPYFFSSSVFAAPVSTQALVVEAFREVTGDEESADACNVWLLKQKQTQDWTTTAATADAVYALLLGGGADLLAGDSLADVTLGGEKVKADGAEAGTGMYSVRYAADAVRPRMGEISFTGAGEKGVSWGGVHWSYFEDVLKVRAHEPKELKVEKKYYKKVTGPEGTRLASIDGALEPGDEIVARLEIASDRSYEFVHLSDERPACAEPVDVLSSYRWHDGVGYYQSTRDTATHYYMDRLNKGVFVLETSYRVQQKGEFSGGIATIQCMYAPEFTAHSSAEKMRCGRP